MGWVKVRGVAGKGKLGVRGVGILRFPEFKGLELGCVGGFQRVRSKGEIGREGCGKWRFKG